ncbi:MAG: inorganic phosphate transporter family protein [Desulfobacteraceae bacterium]|nr:inorganic phosphate transporter family protein [Desulfobacteraceae bacterium]
MWKLLSGLFFGWSLGANDSANIFGTGVATGTVRYRTAIGLTAAFVVVGAMAEGPKCMTTLDALSRISSMGAFFCALAAGLTIATLTVLAIPASASQAVVGAIVGVGLLSGTADLSPLYKVVACWVFTPVAGAVFSYLLYRIIERVLNRTVRSITRRNFLYFVGILTAGSYGSYSLGANNVANVTGVYVSAALLTPTAASWIGGMSIALGVLTYSRKVMTTVGKGIVPLDPFSAFIVVFAEAATLHVFTQVGVPVSSSQAVVGAVVGVGLVGDLRTVHLSTLGRIGLGWVMTPVAAGALAAGLCHAYTLYGRIQTP